MEKYGEIPARFTKAWWGYFWEYYKLHVLGTAFVVMLVAVWVFQCTHRVKYDMTIVYAGHMTYTEEQQAKICEKAAEYVPDINSDGEVNIYFQPLVFSDKAGNEEYDYAVQTKLDLTFVDDYAYIYLMDEIEATLYMQRDMIDNIFDNAYDYGGLDMKYLSGYADAPAYAISLNGSKFLQLNDIKQDDLYIMVRKNTNPDDEKNTKAHDGAIKFAQALLSEI